VLVRASLSEDDGVARLARRRFGKEAPFCLRLTSEGKPIETCLPSTHDGNILTKRIFSFSEISMIAAISHHTCSSAVSIRR
jgi:hypothetical protein